MKTADYIRAIKEMHNYTSDYAVAKALGVSRQRVSQYVNGKNVPGPLVAYRIAYILREQPAAVVADLERERAELAGNFPEADQWDGIIRSIGKGAASILLACGLGGFPNADAGLRHLSTDAAVYTSSQAGKRRRRKAGPWDGLKRRVAAARQALSEMTGCLCPALVPAGAF